MATIVNMRDRPDLRRQLQQVRRARRRGADRPPVALGQSNHVLGRR